MKKRVLVIVALSLFVMCLPLSLSAEEAPPKIKGLAASTLAAIGMDPVIVSAVKADNAKKKSLEQIKADDKIWRETPGISDFMKTVMDSECSKYIRTIQSGKAYFSEIFVMDNQGANVAMTDKTSDYWQGDEDKFIKSFNQGKGSVFVDQVEFDDSSQAYLVQISVPVMDGGACIGAITFGIDVDKVE